MVLLFQFLFLFFNRSQPVDFNLMRGAVFYIGMALWGFRKVPSLKHTPAAVLPSFLHVCLEYLLVFLSIQRHYLGVIY